MLRPVLLRDLRRPSGNLRLVTPVIELLQRGEGPGIVEQVKFTVPADQLGDEEGQGGQTSSAPAATN